jgi:hypothetical protein
MLPNVQHRLAFIFLATQRAEYQARDGYDMEVATGVLGIFHAAHFKQVLKIEQQVSQPLILVVVVDQANIQTTSQ